MSDTSILSTDFFVPIKDRFISQNGFDESAFNREVSFAIQHLHKNPYLQKADPVSVLKAVLNISQIGLTLNPVSKHAYLVPRYNGATKSLECVLDPSYIGLSKLLTDSNSINNISCQLVYEGDEIDIDMSSDKKIEKHVPYMFTDNERGNIKGVYSLASLSTGEKHCELMSIVDVNDIRERSESYKAFKSGKVKSCIWITDYGQMIRKTCIKRHYNQLPKSAINGNLENAIELSNVSSGFSKPVTFGAISMIESLINSCNLSEDEKSNIWDEVYSIEYQHEASKIIDHLKSNEQILGLERFPHSQKEIQDITKQKASEDNS